MRFIILFFLGSCTFLGFGQSGKVVNKVGTPIANVNIQVLNSVTQLRTNYKGQFQLPVLNQNNYTIKISKKGYATKTLDVNFPLKSEILITLSEASSDLGELVVTAEKQEQKLQKIPYTVSNIEGTQIQDFTIYNIKELSAYIPNFNALNPGDGRNNVSIRGITSTSYDPAVATYIDGVSQIRLDAYIPQLFDIERIEVLRGPQGTLYGRNAMGGVINIITKQPTNNVRAYGSAEYSSFNTTRFNFAVQVPLVADKLFVGASFEKYNSDGFYTNVYNNSHFDKNNYVLGNYFLKYLPNKKSSITLNFKHFNRQNNGSFTLSSSPAEAFAHPYQVNYNAIAKNNDKTLNASLTGVHYGKSMTFTSITAYQQNTGYYSAPIDADVQMPFAAQSADITSIEINKSGNTVKFWTQEFRLQSSNKNKLNWNVGSFMFTQNSPNTQTLLFGADASMIGVQGAPFKLQNDVLLKSKGIAFYGQANYKLAEHLTLTGGLRYDYENEELALKNNYIKGNYAATLGDSSASSHFTAVSPKLGLSYDFSNFLIGYANYARGFRTGGISQLSFDPSDAAFVPYKPEYSNNFELGFKYLSNSKKVYLNFAAFYTTVTDAQLPRLIPSLGYQTAITNAGNLTSKGVELELVTKPISGLELLANFGLTDAKYTTLRIPVSLNDSKVEKDFAGNNQVFTPKYTTMLGFNYTRKIVGNLNAMFHFDVRMLGKQYFNLENTIAQDSYTLTNTSLSLLYKRLEFKYWIRNAADVKYLSYGYSFGAVSMGMPRNSGLKMIWSF